MIAKTVGNFSQHIHCVHRIKPNIFNRGDKSCANEIKDCNKGDWRYKENSVLSLYFMFPCLWFYFNY